MAKARIGRDRSADHSLSVCDIKAIEGTRNSTEPPTPTIDSAIRRLVKVLPVPQAMISLPRLDSSNLAVTSVSARL